MTVVILHVPLLELPFFWDEAGYYIPAALELAQHGRLIPQTTAANPHPPLLSIYLAAAYKAFGTSPLVTRLAMSVVAGVAIYALLLLAMLMVPTSAGLWAACLFALTPIVFAQSTLAHLDVAAAAATLFTLYFALRGNLAAYLVAATLLCLTRETGVAVVLVVAVLARSPVMLLPMVPLAGWFAFLRVATGHWLGDPGFVSYNIWAALHPARFLVTLLRRLHFLFFVDFRWIVAVPLVMSLRPSPAKGMTASVRPAAIGLLWWVLAGQVLVMSLFGGALLNRYLLPALALFFLLGMEAAGRIPMPSPFQEFRAWLPLPLLLAQIGCWFWNPPYPFPYEENLAYMDFVSLHQSAAEQLVLMPAGARVLTAWPATDELRRPELGYLGRKGPAQIVPLEDFSESSFSHVRREDFDAVLMFSREWRPSWNVLDELPLLETLRRRLYGRYPAASPEWVQEKFRLNHAGAVRLHGQWIVWLQRDDVDFPPPGFFRKASSPI